MDNIQIILEKLTDQTGRKIQCGYDKGSTPAFLSYEEAIETPFIRFGNAYFIPSLSIDIDNHKIDIHCPSCHFFNTVTLKQVRLRDVVICRGCKANISLEDHLNMTRKTIRSFQRAMRQIEEQLAKIGKITIRL